VLYITAVRLSQGGTKAQHITNVMWLDSSTGKSGGSTTQGMVDFIKGRNTVQVAGADGPANVLVVDKNPPYLRTKEDGSTSDNLLSLPKF